MKYIVKQLSNSKYNAYNDFLLDIDYSLFSYSLPYKCLLEENIKCKSIYLIALEKDAIVGSLPLMLNQNISYGNIINSLPFYGSNGGIIVSPRISKIERSKVREILFKTALDFIAAQNCVASTFITSPLDKEQNSWFHENVEYDFLDKRIGQITELPKLCTDIENILLQKFDDPRPRNIRKAIKAGIVVNYSYEQEALKFLIKTHRENILSIDGIPKEESFFYSIERIIPKRHYRIYIARKDNKLIAALLLFYFNYTVEYFTPCILIDYRNLQPSSLLIFQAMSDAVEMGYQYWNWGGTWFTQNGVYNFKKKWGAEDHYYFYFTRIYDKSILTKSKDQLLKQYTNFYVLPFSELEE